MSEPKGITVKHPEYRPSRMVDKFYGDEEILELFPDCDNSLVNPLLRRAQAAEAIIDKFPKTADGVSIVPGMDVWVMDAHGARHCKLVAVEVYDAEHEGFADPRAYYSTQAAAEEARENQT